MTYKGVSEKHGINKQDTLKIIFCNIEGVSNKLHIIRHFLWIQNPDIFFLIETFLKPHSKINFNNPNYRLFRQDRPSDVRGGGIAVLIKKGINFRLLQQKRSSIEHISILVENQLKLIGGYSPPQNKLHETDFFNLINTHNKVLIMGDPNCRHLQLDSNKPQPNYNVRILQSFCDNSDCTVFSTNTHTHFPYTNQKPSTIDIAIGKNITNLTKIKTITDLVLIQQKHYIRLQNY